ncbi:tRNA dihydrouridine(20/20a) synthase DusA [Buchnera aphidicola (Pseudoregma panicola)]|uniref:tRNA dihydrouridine(20/20a) synthase DusA n=1 Tax=Buchnera aphidicola TaxID=9 RepID=UPI0031B71ACA
MIKKKNNIYRFCVAPMFGYTDEYCRKIYRIISKKTLLFTEMISTNEILKKSKKFIYNKKKENPIAIQISGSNENEISKCAEISYKKNYKYINLNIGCPSIRAQKGNFGAILMKQPKIIINSINNISNNTPIEISIKSRIGINKKDDYKFLKEFIYNISTKSTCKIFIIHARRAILENISTKKNLKIPKINYNLVYKIKKEFPNLKIIINGEIKNVRESLIHLKYTDGVMLGRNIYKKPMILKSVDNKIYNKKKYKSKKILYKIFKYINKKVSEKIPMYKITRHIINIFKNKPYSYIWKKMILSKKNQKKNIKKIFKKYKNFIKHKKL